MALAQPRDSLRPPLEVSWPQASAMGVMATECALGSYARRSAISGPATRCPSDGRLGGSEAGRFGVQQVGVQEGGQRLHRRPSPPRENGKDGFAVPWRTQALTLEHLEFCLGFLVEANRTRSSEFGVPLGFLLKPSKSRAMTHHTETTHHTPVVSLSSNHRDPKQVPIPPFPTIQGQLSHNSKPGTNMVYPEPCFKN